MGARPTHRRGHAALAFFFSVCTASVALAQSPTETWRYYRVGNTGIQGDINEAIWIDSDNDPWIGGYDWFLEEGGIAKFVQAENRWINISNVDYPEIGHPGNIGTSRVSDIVADADGVLWMATGRGALKFDPAVGPSSLVRYDRDNSAMPGGWAQDADVAPDGTIWFAAYTTVYGDGGLARHDPSAGTWTGWPGFGSLICAQRKPLGGYYVWNGGDFSGYVQRFDSDTQEWTALPHTGAPGEVVSPAGKDCVDDAHNFWALRIVGPGLPRSLDYLRIDGTWISPPEPYVAITDEVWAFRAFGVEQALMVDGQGVVWRFDGSTWESRGTWRPGPFTEAVNIDALGNIWVSGSGGAARRDAVTGQWQRYRVTNTSQYDNGNHGLTIDPAGGVYACANAGPGVGGMVRFDGTRWIGFNNYQYGLGYPWPFPTDNSEAVYCRPSSGHVAVSPSMYGVYELTGSEFVSLESPRFPDEFVEDSFGRLWFISHSRLMVYDGGSWTELLITGSSSKIQRDPARPGTIWAVANLEIVRTDGSYRFSRVIGDFPGLTPFSDQFAGLAVEPGGIAWIGATVQSGASGALIRLDPSDGTYQMLRYDEGWPLPGQFVRPHVMTPDGRIWMRYDDDTGPRGLCWYDGTDVGVFPAPPGGEPQWGGLPHAQIEKLYAREIADGYELWMTCASRGIAVLTVQQSVTGVGEGAAAAASPMLLEPSVPNPSRSSTSIHFTLPRSDHVQLGIYDASGRRVRRLLDGRIEAGRKEMAWDGRDDGGRPVASGVYFWRLDASGTRASRRMVLAR